MSQAVGVTVSPNPMLPEEDAERKFVWQVVPVSASESVPDLIKHLEAKGYEYTRRGPASFSNDPCLLLVYRKEREPERKTEVKTLDTLQFQEQMLTLKLSVDKKAVAMHKFRQDNGDVSW
tara:strand:- start:895 stop:1254 length:360 start_codon:yes stop_codon:yes gene_type:complete